MTHRSTRPGRRWHGLVVAVAILAALGVVAVIGTRWIARNDVLPVSTPWGPECSVWTGEEQVRLDRDQAQRATTAAAVSAQGDSAPIEAPDTDDIPDAVTAVLEDGPEDDAGPSLTCRSVKNRELGVEEDLEPSGLTPRAEGLKDGMEEYFSDLSLGGYHPGGYDTGHGEGSAHYEGRAIDIFYRPVDEDNRREGWLMAHWLIAHAPDYEIDVIIFDDRIWSTSYPSLGWRDYDADPDNEILRHLDHVHVDVQRGNGADGG
ncbi:hypothetical protein Q8791_12075 [Nocardiopsis sp. CT-R113]|uniref:ARB-07466-like C-terminal domain-containing protein n=1 Tax=Nocardiopsis codii TaxID=3065942 RepID=A0ABU7K6S7_9ACTN|nr:hypothetical protein [Nocardiopsis sp. CT-R113]MEE2037955.1 hypothetical protein [Nocardiopsis sp. CT-R113]